MTHPIVLLYRCCLLTDIAFQQKLFSHRGYLQTQNVFLWRFSYFGTPSLSLMRGTMLDNLVQIQAEWVRLFTQPHTFLTMGKSLKTWKVSKKRLREKRYYPTKKLSVLMIIIQHYTMPVGNKSKLCQKIRNIQTKLFHLIILQNKYIII